MDADEIMRQEKGAFMIKLVLFEKGDLVFPRGPLPVVSEKIGGKRFRILKSKPLFVERRDRGGTENRGLLEFEGQDGQFDAILFKFSGI